MNSSTWGLNSHSFCVAFFETVSGLLNADDLYEASRFCLWLFGKSSSSAGGVVFNQAGFYFG
jgi:hypothetical protein